MVRVFCLIPVFVAALLVLPAGCPDDGVGGDAGQTPNEVRAAAPAQAAVGEKVTLTAEAVAESGTLTYRWYQVFGRVVTLEAADTLAASFTAPSFAKDEMLRFRVDARIGSGDVRSAEVELMVLADPEHGLGGGSGGGGGDGGGGSDDDPSPRVQLVTSMGNIVLELNRTAAPISVENFLRYVDEGYYDGTVFHRVISDFVVQGGGYDEQYELKDTRPPILNEGSNGLKNLRGTLAMARTNDANSATSQFYINLVDNDSLDFRSDFPGYAVFGRVTVGMDIVDEIAAVETASRAGVGEDVPVQAVVLERATRLKALGGGTGGDTDTSTNGGSNDEDDDPIRTPGVSAGG